MLSNTNTPTHVATSEPAPLPASTRRPATMLAAARDRYGDVADVVHVAEVPVPVPGAGEVLVRVRAAGVDRGTWHLATGRPHAVRPVSGVRRPRQHVLGLDVAGTVIALGEGVADLEVGDEVFGTGQATFARYAVAPASQLSRRPQGLDAHEAAALPVSGSTARQAVEVVAATQPGERVLVIGASGGVGSYAVQLAVAAGAEVVGVASGPKADFVGSLGAVDVIDHRHEQIDARPGGYDVVVDLAGNRPLRVLRRVLAPAGRLVIVGGESGGPVLGGTERNFRAALLDPFVGQRLRAILARTTREHLAALAQHAATGRLRPVVTRTYGLEEAGSALADLEAGRITGKAVVVP
jgi:NADPH:quinone reductase-like Zn-dependent oxidoreductase